MGLDDFIDDADSSDLSTSTSSDDTDNESDITERQGIVKTDDGDITPRGPIGYETIDEFRETVGDSLDTHGDLFKYELPIFPHIELNTNYDQQVRLESDNSHSVLSCIDCGEMKLSSISRELIMLDTGETNKEKCMEVLRERLGSEPLPNLVVNLYFFAKVRHIAKMAIADEMTDSWGPHDKDGMLKAVYGETWTQQFSKVDSDNYEHKHWNHIEEW